MDRVCLRKTTKKMKEKEILQARVRDQLKYANHTGINITSLRETIIQGVNTIASI